MLSDCVYVCLYVVWLYASAVCDVYTNHVYEWICVMADCEGGGGAERRARGQRVIWQYSEGVGLSLGPVSADAGRSY